jgi:hypothetical protein
MPDAFNIARLSAASTLCHHQHRKDGPSARRIVGLMAAAAESYHRQTHDKLAALPQQL